VFNEKRVRDLKVDNSRWLSKLKSTRGEIDKQERPRRIFALKGKVRELVLRAMRKDQVVGKRKGGRWKSTNWGNFLNDCFSKTRRSGHANGGPVVRVIKCGETKALTGKNMKRTGLEICKRPGYDYGLCKTKGNKNEDRTIRGELSAGVTGAKALELLGGENNGFVGKLEK